MLKIYDGRDYFYQWDRGQRLIVDDPRVSEVNFCNGTLDCTLDADIYEEDGLRLANVPDVLLQTDKAINVFTVIKCEGQATTTRSQKFHVQRRTKPDDYADPPDDPVLPEPPKMQEKAITANGEYTPDEGYDGFSKVIVNVPARADNPVPAAVTSAEEMEALLASAPIGAVYEYAGEATEKYETGTLYRVCKE